MRIIFASPAPSLAIKWNSVTIPQPVSKEVVVDDPSQSFMTTTTEAAKISPLYHLNNPIPQKSEAAKISPHHIININKQIKPEAAKIRPLNHRQTINLKINPTTKHLLLHACAQKITISRQT